MTEKQVMGYGSWPSPITSDLVVTGAVRLKNPFYRNKTDIYWIEMRPNEGGRSAIVKRLANGQTIDVNPLPFNARTRVHEYGGGGVLIVDEQVYFSNFSDQRVYQINTNSSDFTPKAVTSEGAFYYADAVFDKAHNRLICVREDHSNSDQEAANSIVTIDLSGENNGDVLVAGNDFYSSPRLSPDGSKLAWLSWNHPNMPWDGTELWVGKFDENGNIEEAEKIAGSKTESIFQPEWSPDGVLYFVSDRSGWWNLYRFKQGQVEALCEKKAEFGLPQWVFGMKTYAFISSDEIACTYTENGIWYLAILNTQSKLLKDIELPYTEISDLEVADKALLFVGGSPTSLTEIVRYDLSTSEITVLKQSSSAIIDPRYLSIPKEIEFPTENGLTAHAFYYAPKNPDCQAPAGEKPPLLVKSHGGPTAATSSVLSLSLQYWTSRGFAVLDVNYGGSTGYGREYQQRLRDSWGIVDVDDCVNAAKYLIERSEADPKRLAIDGGSAGGYTTLCVLTFRDVFQAGASYFGVSDLKALVDDTHKFESRYLDNLIGKYPEQKEIYYQRSPINFVEKLSCPVILLQGLEDKVVPPNQAETMVAALKEKKIPVAYVAFEGEQHGFRRAENIKRSLEAEYYFYSQIFKFALSEPITPVEIENLDKI